MVASLIIMLFLSIFCVKVVRRGLLVVVIMMIRHMPLILLTVYFMIVSRVAFLGLLRLNRYRLFYHWFG